MVWTAKTAKLCSMICMSICMSSASILPDKTEKTCHAPLHEPGEGSTGHTENGRIVVELAQRTQRVLMGAELCKAHALAGGLASFVQLLRIAQDLDLCRRAKSQPHLPAITLSVCSGC